MASFWTGPALSLVEQICLKSFVDRGHPITLYSYDEIEGVPNGVRCADAGDILDRPQTYTVHPRTGSPAPFADRFRYHLLRKCPGVIRADTDAYCLRPFTPDVDGYFFGWADAQRSVVANGVMALPADSAVLDELICWTENETAILPWLPGKLLHEACARARDGDPMHVTEMPWGIWGPAALTYVLRRHGHIDRALDHSVLYPVQYQDRRRYFRHARMTWEQVGPMTQSIHFYGRRVRERLLHDHDGVPPPGTVLARLAKRHDIRP